MAYDVNNFGVGHNENDIVPGKGKEKVVEDNADDYKAKWTSFD